MGFFVRFYYGKIAFFHLRSQNFWLKGHFLILPCSFLLLLSFPSFTLHNWALTPNAALAYIGTFSHSILMKNSYWHYPHFRRQESWSTKRFSSFLTFTSFQRAKPGFKFRSGSSRCLILLQLCMYAFIYFCSLVNFCNFYKT